MITEDIINIYLSLYYNINLCKTAKNEEDEKSLIETMERIKKCEIYIRDKELNK